MPCQPHRLGVERRPLGEQGANVLPLSLDEREHDRQHVG